MSLYSLYDMPIEEGWADPEPEPEARPVGWLRVTPQEPRAVVVLSAAPLRYAGHWHPATQRFRRCPEPDTGRCVQCAAAVGRQRRYVVAVADEAGRQWAWEFGDQQAGPIQALLRGGRALRGLPLVLSRVPAGAGKSPILVRLDAPEGAPAGPPGEDDGPGDGAADGLPEAADVAAVLWGTWVRQALAEGKAGQAPPPPAKPASSTPSPAPAKPAPGPPPDFRADYERQTGRRPRGL